ncbi:uncharacterized protein [Polyergus mexicanus]|uniref:uncharacterized protein n=1 Tax=Polyergus mexicanus TaxID=615972 RepID=UPI0038B5182D
MKASVVERFNRKLKNNIWKIFTLNGNYKCIDTLLIVREYNARKQHTIGMRPIDVTPAIADKLLNTIVKVQKTNLVTYVFENSRGNPVAGGFYEYELHHVANPDVHLVEKVIRKEDDKVYEMAGI